MRINKFIAHATNLSRREADNAVAAGRVHIDGRVADMGAQVNESNVVMFDGKKLGQKTSYTYLMLNKPIGYLCSRRSQGGVPTIYSLLPEKYRPLKAVGRLDKDSSGLILLTDDGDFAFQMTHPSFHKVKAYEVELDKPLQPLHQQMISDYGVMLEDGVSQFLIEKLEYSNKRVADGGAAPTQTTAVQESRGADRLTGPVLSDLRVVEDDNDGSGKAYRITMHEGRNRQIRRTFAALGYTVTKLHRTTFGPYHLGQLGNKQFTQITA